ncbi:MAG TPA: glycoside hydrolase family 15 protein [Mycobacterium sp.]|nr:glycoside hydrolase family 15 protein [Mycobacterium sp.]
MSRVNGYAPIADYAAIGDGRTVGLIASDGAIDWLCLPDMDSSPVFGALLDSDYGGRFVVAPGIPFSTTRRYLPETNVLETTFWTDRGTVCVKDALAIPDGGLFPLRELVRIVEGVSGGVPICWSMSAGFEFGTSEPRVRSRDSVALFDAGSDGLALSVWEAGTVTVIERRLAGFFTTRPGSRATFALSAGHQEPVVIPARHDAERRLEHTAAFWRGWTAERRYEGPWAEVVLRSALALKLLVFAPSGAIAAAATTSLPEELGGERNWDYRFCWLRDAAFIMNALLQVGCAPEAEAFFWWLMHASQLTHPKLGVLYRLNGDASASEREITSFAGYRGSRPVRVGNGAVDQLQLDVYGDVMHAAWLYANSGRAIDSDIGRRLAHTATFVSDTWNRPDAGLWEVRSEPQHFTQSKMMCWVALDRASRLAHDGHIPAGDISRWCDAMDDIATFIDRFCWSRTLNSYTRSAGSDDLDASLLLGVLFAYRGSHEGRLDATVDAIRNELTHGPFVHRYVGDDGLGGNEGAFLACSFWLVEALALLGQHSDATALMQELVALANDVGLYGEEINPTSGEFLGNFPQGLTHLALINAAAALRQNRNR